MPKLPSMQFYPGDWRKDPGVQSLDYETRGIWFEILLLMFESQERGTLLLNGLPMPEDALARFLGLDNQKTTKAITKLLTYGVVSKDAKGALICRRMVRDEEIRRVRAASGSLGGNPLLLKQKSTPSKEDENEGEDREQRQERTTARKFSSDSPETHAVFDAYPNTRKINGKSSYVGKTLNDYNLIAGVLNNKPDYPLLEVVKLYAASTEAPKDLRGFLAALPDPATLRSASPRKGVQVDWAPAA